MQVSTWLANFANYFSLSRDYHIIFKRSHKTLYVYMYLGTFILVYSNLMHSQLCELVGFEKYERFRNLPVIMHAGNVFEFSQYTPYTLANYLLSFVHKQLL